MKESLKDADTDDERRPWARVISYWASTAEKLLDERGNLMHSNWVVDSDVDPRDLARTGLITQEEAESVERTAERKSLAQAPALVSN